MIDLSRDAHVHTAYSAGHDSVSVLVAAAEAAGLTELTFADRVGSDTGWLTLVPGHHPAGAAAHRRRRCGPAWRSRRSASTGGWRSRPTSASSR